MVFSKPFPNLFEQKAPSIEIQTPLISISSFNLQNEIEIPITKTEISFWFHAFCKEVINREWWGFEWFPYISPLIYIFTQTPQNKANPLFQMEKQIGNSNEFWCPSENDSPRAVTKTFLSIAFPLILQFQFISFGNSIFI